MDAEVETRELSLLQLQHYARCCVDDVEMNSQVLCAIEHLPIHDSEKTL